MDQEQKNKYYEALEDVVDPELGIDIVNLGLIYGVEIDEDGNLRVEMTLTSMGCPAGPQLVEQVKYALEDFEEVKDIRVDIVWSPQWNKDMMSRYGKIALGIHD